MPKKKQTSSPTSPPRFAIMGGLLSALVRASTRTIVAAGPMALVLLATAAGLVHVWERSFREPAYQFQPSLDIDAFGASRMPEEARRELLHLAQRLRGSSLLDPQLTHRLRAAYEESPWVREARPFRRSLEKRTVVIDLVLRLPSAQVAHKGRYYQIDAQGVRLPLPPQRRPIEKMPRIHAHTEDLPQPGARWREPGLHAALGVLQTLRASAVHSRLAVKSLRVHTGSFIDRHLRNRAIRPRITIETTSGAEIRWGTYAAQQPELDTPSSAEKLRMLDQLLERHGQLANGEVVDVRTQAVSYSGQASQN